MKRKSKLLDVVKRMPPLYHTLPGCAFDITKSEAVEWLLRQPDMMSYLWNHVRNSKFIEYDVSTGKWKGVDFEDGVFHGDGSADGDRAGAQGEGRQWQAGVF